MIAEFFLFLHQYLGLSVLVVKGYRAALNHVFLLTGMNLAACSVVFRIFRHFEMSFPPCKIQPPDCNLSLVLRCSSRPPFEPLKLASDKHLTWKTYFLLALVSAKRVGELHLSFRVHHSRGWRSCTFSFLPDLVAKTQNPSLSDSRFEEFLVPSLDDFIGDDRDKLLMCPIPSLWKFLSRTESIVLGLRACSSLLDERRRGSPIT